MGNIDYFSFACLTFYYTWKQRLVLRTVEAPNYGYCCLQRPREAQHAHIVLDVMACPYVNQSLRLEVLAALQSDLQLPQGTIAEQNACIQEIEANPWFVNWQEIDLLNHLRKKELSAIY